MLVLVGCGFVGSIFATEYLRRAFAGEIPLPLRFVDGDVWERRNAANQNVSLVDATEGYAKADTMALLAQQFEKPAESVVDRIVPGNWRKVLEDARVIVDAVDNLKTRQLLYDKGLALNVPVCHVGITESGTGTVEWSHPKHDTFHLAPHRTADKVIVDPESGVLKPCELARMRGVGLNVGFAAAMSVALFLGFDPEVNIAEGDSRGWLTEWQATPSSFFPVGETWTRLTEVGNG